MGRKFEVWCDSGANIHSCRRQVVDLDDIGIESDAWDAMDDKERDEVMQEVAWNHLEWGFEEIE